MKTLKEKLSAKLHKNGGFTIVEMLIVVAIIAILIAISIPMFTAALERTRHAVDDANRRDAISLGNIEYLTRQNDTTNFTSKLPKLYVYKVDETDGGKDYQGHLVEAASGGVAAKCTNVSTAVCGSSPASGNLFVVISKSGDVHADFYASDTAAKAGAVTAGGEDFQF